MSDHRALLSWTISAIWLSLSAGVAWQATYGSVELREERWATAYRYAVVAWLAWALGASQ